MTIKIFHYGDQHVRPKDLEECARCLDFCRDSARAEAVDLIISAGDLADSQDLKAGDPAAELMIRHISEMADIAPVVIVRGTPSHDGNIPRLLQYVRGRFPIIVADRPMQVFLLPGGQLVSLDSHPFKPDAIITLIPQVTKQYFHTQAGIADADQEISQAMTGIFAGFGATAAQYPGVPHIMGYHGGISGAALPSGQARTGMDIEVSTDQMMMAGPDLVCCGHIHKAQQVGSGPVYYSGPIYATKVDEAGPNGFYVHELDELDGSFMKASRFIETPCRRIVRFTRDLREENVEPLYCDGADGAVVRLEFTTWQDEAGKIDKEAITREWMEQGAAEVDIRITRIPRETVRAEAVLKAETLRAKVERRAEIVGEQVAPEVLAMADLLEGTAADVLLRQVMGGAA